MDNEVLKKKILSADIDKAEDIISELKLKDKKAFNKLIDVLKVNFILLDDILLLNKLALIFSTFKIHSAVPLIIGKLVKGNYVETGGTLVYALKGLRIRSFEEYIAGLRSSDISYEMAVMIKMLEK